MLLALHFWSPNCWWMFTAWGRIAVLFFTFFFKSKSPDFQLFKRKKQTLLFSDSVQLKKKKKLKKRCFKGIQISRMAVVQPWDWAGVRICSWCRRASCTLWYEMCVRKQSGGDVKNGVGAGTCPICSVFWKPLYRSSKEELRAQQPYLYSNLLHRNPHCQAHKRFIEQGKARSYRKLDRRCLLQMQNKKIK